MLIFLTILFFIMAVLFGYSAIVSMKKVEKYEDWTNDASEKIESVILRFNAIDEGGAFKADDEVGEAFEQLVSIVNELQVLVYDTDEAK